MCISAFSVLVLWYSIVIQYQCLVLQDMRNVYRMRLSSDILALLVVSRPPIGIQRNWILPRELYCMYSRHETSAFVHIINLRLIYTDIVISYNSYEPLYKYSFMVIISSFNFNYPLGIADYECKQDCYVIQFTT